MLEVHQRLGSDSTGEIDDQLLLDHLQRERGRFKAKAVSGTEVRVFLERGKTLSLGEILLSSCGKRIEVRGAIEEVVTAHCDDWMLLSRACYHLGNRHVKLQVGEGWLRIVADHVLEAMLRHLGLDPQLEQAVFDPESGAYAAHDHQKSAETGAAQHGHQH